MLKLMYITNEVSLAKAAEKAGVDRIMVDLERLGKAERQKGWNSFISDHEEKDIKGIKNALKVSEVVVRINPIHDGSKEEIERVISLGADIIMLPYFKKAKDVKEMIALVNGRKKVCLLLETKEAVEDIDTILSVPGIDEIHIGLNDLSHSYEEDFLFETFSNGTIDHIVKKLKAHKIKDYGIGGIARISSGLIPAEDVITEHKRLGSGCAILSRAFFDKDKNADELFETEVKKIRAFEEKAEKFSCEELQKARARFNEKVKEVVKNLSGS